MDGSRNALEFSVKKPFIKDYEENVVADGRKWKDELDSLIATAPPAAALQGATHV